MPREEMIPKKRKSAEEIAALREELGIPDELPRPGEQRQRPAQKSEPKQKKNKKQKAKAEPKAEKKPTQAPAPQQAATKHYELPIREAKTKLDPATGPRPRRPVVHLEPEASTKSKAKEPQSKPVLHSLRKQELPLAPAPKVTHKTALPTSRQDPDDIARIRRAQAINSLGDSPHNPALHLQKITAHWLLLTPAYLSAFGAGLTAWQYFHITTPLALLLVAIGITTFIAIRKKRSRHHAAILFIIILMTLVFGGLHYAPLFQNAS